MKVLLTITLLFFATEYLLAQESKIKPSNTQTAIGITSTYLATTTSGHLSDTKIRNVEYIQGKKSSNQIPEYQRGKGFNNPIHLPNLVVTGKPNHSARWEDSFFE